MRTAAKVAAVALAVAGLAYVAAVEAQIAPSPFTARAFTATAGAGSSGFTCRTTGCRVDLGPGASDYIAGNGSAVLTGGDLNVAGATWTASLAGTSGTGYVNVSTAVRWTTGGSVASCNSSNEGVILRQVSTGGAGSGTETRFCACVSNGAASPVYSWRNVISGTAGTASTCNP